MRCGHYFALLLIPFLYGFAQAGTITGQVFTAEHNDSLARSIPVTLLYRDAAEALQEIEGGTDSLGTYRFVDVPADTSIEYVIRIDSGEHELLSTPIRFEIGQELLASSFLLPSPERGHVPVGSPVEQSHSDLIVILVCVVILFAGLARAGQRSDPVGGQRRFSSGAHQLARDVASLDLRYEDGVIGEEEYTKVRAGLMGKLRTMIKPRQGS